MAGEPEVPPQALEAEESVLGAMIASEKAIAAVLDTGLLAREFYRPTHGVIYTHVLAMYSDSIPVDWITLVDRLEEQGALKQAGGRERLAEIAHLGLATSNAAHHARIVREAAGLRGLIEGGQRITKLGKERPGDLPDLVEQAQSIVFDLALDGTAGDFVAVSEPLTETFRRIEEAGERGDEVAGLTTGFRHFDDLTSGLQPGNLIVVAARPSMGKTAFGLNAAAHVAVHKKLPVALFTLEMSRYEVTQRLLSAEAMVRSQKIRTGNLSLEEWSNLNAAGARLHVAPLMIDDSGAITAVELRAKAMRLKLRHPDLALIVVDYLQLMTSGGDKWENRQQDVSLTSRSLKVLARDLDVPVLAMSQLSRQVEQRHDKRPVLSDLRESGAIEQDADLVVFLYRDEYYHPEDTDQHGIAEVNVAKQRNGPTGMTKLAFVKRYAKFTDLAPDAAAS